MSQDLSTQSQALESALASFQQSNAKLYDADGSPIYAPAEHQRRSEQLLAELDRVVSAAMAAAAEAETAARRALQELNGRDPFDGLTPEEQARVTAKRELVAEDFRELPLEPLARRAQAALVTKDRAEAFLIARYGARRVESETKRAAQGQSTPLERLGLSQLKTAVEQLQGELTDAKARERVMARRSAAQELDIQARRVRAEADGRLAAARDIRNYW